MLIRAKKLGVLLREARKISGQSAAVCAQAIGVSEEQYRAYEFGDQMPSLPEIEVLAYFLNVPISHFWDGPQLTMHQKTRLENLDKALALRHRLVGALLRKYRLEAGLSLEGLSSRVGQSPEALEQFELGERPVPLPLLEHIAVALRRSIRDFYDQKGPFGRWMTQQDAIQEFLELPPDLQAFVGKPVNRPFLELAQRLSEMPVQKLRTVAEGLLEITL